MSAEWVVWGVYVDFHSIYGDRVVISVLIVSQVRLCGWDATNQIRKRTNSVHEHISAHMAKHFAHSHPSSRPLHYGLKP